MNHNGKEFSLFIYVFFFFFCSCSVAQSHPTLCDLMDCSMPGLSVLHHLPEVAQTHVHRVSDAIQPSHPLSSPSPPAFNLSQHQGFSNRWPKYWSFSFSVSPSSNAQDGSPSGWPGWISLQPRGSQEASRHRSSEALSRAPGPYTTLSSVICFIHSVNSVCCQSPSPSSF